MLHAWLIALALVPSQKFSISPGFSISRGAEKSKYVDPQIEYMPKHIQDAWIKTLPAHTDDARLAALLKRPLICYNHDVMPRVSQWYNEAWSGEYNRSATQHPVGVTTRDPQWRHTAGFPEETKVVNFIALPDTGDIKVWSAFKGPTSEQGGISGDSGMLTFAQFPVGTTFIEAGYQVIDGHDVCFELRTRTKVTDGYGVDHWRPNRYVPCRDPKEYDEAVKLATGTSPNIMEQIKNQYRKEQFGFTFPRYEKTALRREAYQVKLPKVEPAAVAKILKTQPFRSTLDRNWEEFNDGTCAAPTTEHDEQIYPKGYNAAFFPTTIKSCRNCHEDDGKTASDLGPGDWYGVTQTYDSVMSFTPLKPIYSRVSERQQIDPRIANSPRVKTR